MACVPGGTVPGHGGMQRPPRPEVWGAYPMLGHVFPIEVTQTPTIPNWKCSSHDSLRPAKHLPFMEESLFTQSKKRLFSS